MSVSELAFGEKEMNRIRKQHRQKVIRTWLFALACGALGIGAQ